MIFNEEELKILVRDTLVEILNNSGLSGSDISAAIEHGGVIENDADREVKALEAEEQKSKRSRKPSKKKLDAAKAISEVTGETEAVCMSFLEQAKGDFGTAIELIKSLQEMPAAIGKAAGEALVKKEQKVIDAIVKERKEKAQDGVVGPEDMPEEYNYEHMMTDIRDAVANYDGGASEARGLAKTFCQKAFRVDKFKDLDEEDYRAAAKGVVDELA